MTPTKRNQRGDSTGLVLLVVAIAALTIGPAAADARNTAVEAGTQDLQVYVSAPQQHAFSRRDLLISVTCQSRSGLAAMCRSRLRISFQASNGKRLRIPPTAHVATCHPGSNQAPRCWIPVGEPTVYRRHVARGAAALIVRRALRRGPVWMKVTAEGFSQTGAKGVGTTIIKITRGHSRAGRATATR